MTREKIKKLEKIINEVVEFPDGSMTFRKHVKHSNGSVDGWYAILQEKEEIDTGFTSMNETEGWTEEDKKNYKEILTHLECLGNSATLDVNRKKWRILESWFKRRVPVLSFISRGR